MVQVDAWHGALIVATCFLTSTTLFAQTDADNSAGNSANADATTPAPPTDGWMDNVDSFFWHLPGHAIAKGAVFSILAPRNSSRYLMPGRSIRTPMVRAQRNKFTLAIFADEGVSITRTDIKDGKAHQNGI